MFIETVVLQKMNDSKELVLASIVTVLSIIWHLYMWKGKIAKRMFLIPKPLRLSLAASGGTFALIFGSITALYIVGNIRQSTTSLHHSLALKIVEGFAFLILFTTCLVQWSLIFRGKPSWLIPPRYRDDKN